MKALPNSPDLLDVARNVVWFEEPEKVLSDPVRFMAYFMTYGTPEDLAVVSRYVDEDGFREAIQKAPPGIIDERSWAYWNLRAGRVPPPPMPHRRLGDDDQTREP